MSDWKELELKSDIHISHIDPKELHSLICEALITENDYWIVEIDLDIYFRVFNSLEQMAEDVWNDWIDNDAEEFMDEFMDEYKVDKDIPMIVAQHARQFYMMKTKQLAHEFLNISKEFIRGNPSVLQTIDDTETIEDNSD